MNHRTLWRTKNLVGQSLAGIVAIALGASVSAFAQAAPANLDGRWAATMTQKGGTVIPFRLDISGSGDQLVGTLHNGGADIETTTSASLDNGVVKLNFEHYLTKIEATARLSSLAVALSTSRRANFPSLRPTRSPRSMPRVMWLPPLKRQRRFRISTAHGRCRTTRPRARSPGA